MTAFLNSVVQASNFTPTQASPVPARPSTRGDKKASKLAQTLAVEGSAGKFVNQQDQRFAASELTALNSSTGANNTHLSEAVAKGDHKSVAGVGYGSAEFAALDGLIWKDKVLPKRSQRLYCGLHYLDETALVRDAPEVPPGLNDSHMYQPDKTSTQSGRLEEANCWFHADNRGEEHLRGQIKSIAEGCARLSRSSSAEGGEETVRQKILLLGNVIVNLFSYISEGCDKSAGTFAPFGDVNPRFCQPSFGGRRSYFDQDPSASRRRSIPPRRVCESMSFTGQVQTRSSRYH